MFDISDTLSRLYYLGTEGFYRLGDRLDRRRQTLRKRRIVDRYRDSPNYLNVGGGQFVRDDWRVLDYYSDWYDYGEVYIDFDVNLENLREWPIDDGSVDMVFTSHTLEHLSDDAVEHALDESARVLRPGGTIRISVPDVDIAVRHYELKNVSWFTELRPNNPPEELYTSRHGQEEYVMEEYLLSVFATHLTNARTSGTTDDHCTDFAEVREDWETMECHDFFGKYSQMVRDEWQRANPGLHRNWFDEDRLTSLLRSAGFEDIRVEPSEQSRHTEFCHTAFNKRPFLSINVEGTAPS